MYQNPKITVTTSCYSELVHFDVHQYLKITVSTSCLSKLVITQEHQVVDQSCGEHLASRSGSSRDCEIVAEAARGYVIATFRICVAINLLSRYISSVDGEAFKSLPGKFLKFSKEYKGLPQPHFFWFRTIGAFPVKMYQSLLAVEEGFQKRILLKSIQLSRRYQENSLDKDTLLTEISNLNFRGSYF